MDRIDGANYVTNSGKRQFADKNLGTNTPGTSLIAKWFTGVQETVLGVVEAFGFAPSHADDTQLLQALRMASANNQRSVTANTTLTAADAGMVAVSAAGGSVTLTLPGANAANGKPLTLIIARTDTTANTLTINRAGADVIWPFAQTSVPVQPLGVMVLRSDGASTWHILAAPQRRRLTANLTIYVSSSGSDTNSGLTIGNPLATLNAAWAMIVNTLDLNGYSVTVSVADGTYARLIAYGAPIGGTTGAGSVNFVGNTGAPANCVISATNASAVEANVGAYFTLSGFKLAATGTGPGQGAGVFAAAPGSVVAFTTCEFGACAVADILAASTARVVAFGNYSKSGNSGAHWLTADGGTIDIQGRTLTLTGTPAIGIFAKTSNCGVISCASMTFTGGATGTRYLAEVNGVINTGGGGANYLPGNAAGSQPSGGQYV